MNIGNYIKKHSIKHTCNEGVTCSGSHADGLFEIASDVFIEATLIQKRLTPNTSLPPD
tara:strand:- start:1935 stop:2108 length:174 start_codon:yes stop_codon:yes gene_type:complete